MRPRKALAQALVCTTLLLAACSGVRLAPAGQAPQSAAGSTAIPAPSPMAPSPIRFEKGTCRFEVPEGVQAQCGDVIVPQDHANPGGHTLRLAVVVFKSTGAERRPDPVILLSGGPGEQTVEYAPTVLAEWLPMIGERDLVIFDQRGAGHSRPYLECPELARAEYELLDEPDADVRNKASYEAALECRERLVREGNDLALFNTEQSAADVEDIRTALGYDQVNLMGGSYGTLLAQAVMRDHPAGIRSMVINSVLPLEKSLFIDSAPAAPEAIVRLLDACAADPACSNAYPDLGTVLETTVDELNDTPVPLTLTHPLTGEQYPALLTGDAVVDNLVQLLYWSDLIPSLPRAIYNVSQGDYQLMTRMLGLNLISVEAVSRGMYFSVLCAEDLIGRSEEEYLARLEDLPEPLHSDGDLGNLADYNICDLCREWDVPQADPSVKQPLVSDIPTLVLEGEFDPVTPPAYGELVASYLPNSSFFTLAGAGHDVLTANDCAPELVRAFLDDPAQAPDSACVAALPGVVFDVPGRTRVTLEPFVDAGRGFRGVVPTGWQEMAPASLVRARNMMDPTLFVLQAAPGSTAQLLAVLTQALGLDAGTGPVRRAKAGALTWDFYELELEGCPADLALAEQSGKVYVVLMVSAADERGVLYEQLFTPAVKAMAPLE